MEASTWIEHLNQWNQFLDLMKDYYESNKNNQKLSSKQIENYNLTLQKIKRQKEAIADVKFGAVLNPSLLNEFICPTTSNSLPQTLKLDFYQNLNETQAQAVSAAAGDSLLTLIQGPPGTGKTQVIAELCLQLYKANPNIRILVCSETHVAVNNIITRVAKYNSDIHVLRIRNKDDEDDDVNLYSVEALMDSYYQTLDNIGVKGELVDAIRESLSGSRITSLERDLALSSNIVGMTCNRVGAYDFNSIYDSFDVVIIDEVCKATLPEILLPLAVAKRAVLVGDPNQLPPVFCSEEREIMDSIEKCQLTEYMYIDSLFRDSSRTFFLDTQYRMCNEIGTLISENFYDGKLKNGRNESIPDSVVWISYNPSRGWPVFEKDNVHPKIYNDDEVEIIAGVLHTLDEGVMQKDVSVAVISPYKYQVKRLRDRLKDEEYNYLTVEVNTVDAFQGKERDIVFFSITRTQGSARFFADPRRLNVALSRARDRLFIVGNHEFIESKRNGKNAAEVLYNIFNKSHQLLATVSDVQSQDEYDEDIE